MKKTCIIGIIAALCSVAHASTITNSSVPSMSYASGYEWGITKAMLGNASSLSSFSFTINTTVGNTTPSCQLYIDLIGATPVNGFTTKSSPANSESGSDYWAALYTGVNYYQLGTPTYGYSATGAQDGKDYTTITFAAGSTALNDLNYDLATYGGFNIAFDPNCTYTTSYMKFNYTVSSVPDAAMTVLLLGASLLGLEVFRRKFAPEKNQA